MMDRNSTSFNAKLRHFFQTVDYDVSSNPLRYVQHVVKTYMEQVLGGNIMNAGRGLIINHTMGIGKTITAIELMDMLRLLGHRVICIGPKATAENLDVNVEKWSKIIGRPILQNADGSPAYVYLTLRANNLAEQIKREAYVPTVDGRKVGSVPASATLTGALRKTVVVIDEAHLFCNSVAHGRANAVDLYRALMAATDCYVFLLTGTLVVNSPFEAVPAINLVLGKPYLPETEDEFNERYGTPELQRLNGAYIQNIASGLLSYAAIDTDDPDFPKKMRTKVHMLEMQGEQLSKYIDAREIEIAENKAAGTDDRDRKIFLRSFEGAAKTSSSYRVRSRIASNGSNKIAALCEIVAANPKHLITVHVPFVERGGVYDFAAGLRDRLGYKELVIRDGRVVSGPTTDLNDDINSVPPEPTDRYYVVLSGENSDKSTIATMLLILNCSNNRYGAYCHVFLMTSVGAVGIDLKNNRIPVYISPSWNLEEYNQFVGRSLRFGAHAMLPIEERTVQPHIFVSIEPRDENGIRKPSTDEYLLELSMMKTRANLSFMNLLRSVSIECLAGISPDPTLCRTCLATDVALTYGSHRNDIRLPNPCVEARVALTDPEKLAKLEATDGVHMYEIRYERLPTGHYMMYEYDPKAMQYIKIGHGHPLYAHIVKQLQE